jgi:hypothetical protein
MDKAMRLLDEMQYVGDPVADRLAEELALEMGARKAVDWLTDCVRYQPPVGGTSSHPHVDAALEKFDVATVVLPPWHRDADIRRGHEVFRDHALLGFVVLGCASLPQCYCWRDEARILGLTQQLTGHVERRIPETAQFVLDVMSTGGLLGPGHDDGRPPASAPGGGGPVPAGFRSIQKVRLMHALMRFLILAEPGEVDDFLGAGTRPTLWHRMMQCQWAPAVSGVPISQSFLAGTLLTFSLVVVDGLKRLWAPVTDRQAVDYLHTWKIIGHNLGVDERLLVYFDDLDAARTLHDAMMARHRAPTPDGAQLAAALERYMVNSIVSRVPLAGPLGLRQLPRVITWHLSGSDTCRAVGMVPNAWPRAYGRLAWAGLKSLGLMERLPLLRRLSHRVYRWLATIMWDWRRVDAQPADAAQGPGAVGRAGRPARGPRIPHHIADHWGLD